MTDERLKELEQGGGYRYPGSEEDIRTELVAEVRRLRGDKWYVWAMSMAGDLIVQGDCHCDYCEGDECAVCVARKVVGGS